LSRRIYKKLILLKGFNWEAGSGKNNDFRYLLGVIIKILCVIFIES